MVSAYGANVEVEVLESIILIRRKHQQAGGVIYCCRTRGSLVCREGVCCQQLST